jgi:hypothetical protein
MSKTTILIDNQTREQLKKFGIKGQTYDAIIQDLMKSKEGGP